MTPSPSPSPPREGPISTQSTSRPENAVSLDTATHLAHESSEVEYIDLPAGKVLNETTALALASSRPVRWILLAGPIDSGKTTLLSSLYELFQWNKAEGFVFAGSNTLPGFEERCYLSRKVSGGTVPETQRTRFEGIEPLYLHLRVRSTEGLRLFTDLLITDVSGELFEHARDNTSECKEMVFLKRTNHFIILLDSEKAIQMDKRWAMIEDAKALLRSCVDSGMLAEDCTVTVAWSRFDYFHPGVSDKNQSFRSDVQEDFNVTFQHTVPKLRFTEIAARPLNVPELGMAYGVQSLLKEWTTPSDTPDLFPKSYKGTRESELFGTRYFNSITSNEK